MPSVAGAFATDQPGLVHPDFVLGDRDGSTSDPPSASSSPRGCASAATTYRSTTRTRAWNWCARSAARPMAATACQIEINRKLYMDEVSLQPNDQLSAPEGALCELTAALVDWTRTASLTPDVCALVAWFAPAMQPPCWTTTPAGLFSPAPRLDGAGGTASRRPCAFLFPCHQRAFKHTA